LLFIFSFIAISNWRGNTSLKMGRCSQERTPPPRGLFSFTVVHMIRGRTGPLPGIVHNIQNRPLRPSIPEQSVGVGSSQLPSNPRLSQGKSISGHQSRLSRRRLATGPRLSSSSATLDDGRANKSRFENGGEVREREQTRTTRTLDERDFNWYTGTNERVTA
jgi:hypothetical protein